MDAESIRLVQTSFERILPLTDRVAALFFRRLSELDPLLQPEADTDLAKRGRVLMAMLLSVVKGLHRLDQLLPFVQEIGVRNVRHTQIEAHYLTVGAALLWTLEQSLGADFTPKVRLAWLHAYTTTVAMLQSASDTRYAPPMGERGLAMQYGQA